MRSFTFLATLCAIAPVIAFPSHGDAGAQESCFPTPRQPVRAPLISSKFPYTGAKMDGTIGTQRGGVPVPMPGDKDHEFQHPPPGAYRGPWYDFNE